MGFIGDSFLTLQYHLLICVKNINLTTVWSDICQNAFNALKQALLQSQLLTAPDQKKPFVVQIDASEAGLGAILLQQDVEGELRPLVFTSKTLLPRERNYAAVEKECLAVVWALDKLCSYLWGQWFTIETDHSPLYWFGRVKNSNQELLRWSLTLQDFDFDIIHIKGSANKVTGCLSRIYADYEDSS